MASTSTQFATTRRMGIYDSLHQISMWEDVFEGTIMPNATSPTILQVDSRLDNKPEYSSPEPLEQSPDTQSTKNISDKLQRRLAQNREAARKSRLRKKAYVQQLETGRMKLAQLEQELERARQQGVFGSPINVGSTLLSGSVVNPGIAKFEMEYDLWVGEQQKKDSELRNVLQSNLSDIELRIFVDSGLNHYHDLFRMKAEVAKVDVFYLTSAVWRSPVERFFHWIGGFRPSEILSVIIPQLEPLTDQQLASVNNLRHSCEQAEDALSQGMDKLQQTLAQSISFDLTGVVNYNTQIVSSIERLEALENFVNQADHLRQQTLQQMSRLLTTRQVARGLLALGEYFQRLRSLSSLWSARHCKVT